MIRVSLRGKKVNHVRFIRRSYRMRGRVERTLIKMMDRKMVFKIKVVNEKSLSGWFCKRSKLEIIDIKMIFIYSAIKIKVKAIAEYSVLKPETSSLSPSAKSNGVRLVSASRVVNQMNERIGQIRAMEEEDDIAIWSLNELWMRRIEIRIRAILTS